MREIEFRGMTENNRWVYGSLIRHGNYCCILEHDEYDMDFPYLDEDLGTIDGKATPVIPETVGQYTELKDKNGNKIFEGDIVECVSWNEFFSLPEYNLLQPFRRLMSVEFHNGAFRMKETMDELMKANYWDLIYDGDIEVIGNIHDNPELLEESK